MVNEEHLNILKQGVDVWNQWRKENPEIKVDLRSANLSNANLSNADLSNANLSNAILSNAFLSSANLSSANLSSANLSFANLGFANLSHADLRSANLSFAILIAALLISTNLSHAALNSVHFAAAKLISADLSNANLSNADLDKANLRHADLRHADLTGAILSSPFLHQANLMDATVGSTVFGDVDLSEVNGLESIRHYGPSTIGLDTITKSRGKIPEVFLRGAGVPDVFITYMQSLTSEAIKFYSCFISYSSKDKDLAERLYNDLQAQGVRCWYAPEDLKWGAETRQGIDDAIHFHDKLLLILSKHSVESNWVQKEVETAFEEEALRKKQKQKKTTVLFPLRIDPAVMKSEHAWAADIRRMRNIGDFTKWKDHDAYQKAFERLLRDLKAEASNQA